MVRQWCSHCLQFCKAALAAGFISCSTCGKVLGPILLKNVRFKRKKKSKKISHANIVTGVDTSNSEGISKSQ
ncbi:hypothetical protein SLE2022_003110 [Rubroshorea leprosula]